MSLPAQNKERGFTLVELLIAMAITGIILGAVVSTFIIQRKSYALQEQITEMLQNARAAMETMTREIRMAGYHTIGAAFDGITYNAAQLQIRADLNSDGDTNDTDENIIYSHDAANLQIIRNAGADQPLADRIQNFTFNYLDKDGNPTTISANIRQVNIAITARTPKPDPKYAANGGYRTYTLTSLITPRN
jgi:type IV pilus assembly protein PilW